MLTRPAALLPLTLFALLWVGGGVRSYRTEAFDIEVVNATNKPVTISLAKAAVGGPPSPYEAVWATPEDRAWESPRADERWSMEILPPGKSASVNGITGQFDDRTRGVFRAYWGAMKISEMLARSAGSPDRVDVDLVPGRNEIRLIDDNGRLGAQVDQARPGALR